MDFGKRPDVRRVRHFFDTVFTNFVLWHCVYVIDYVIFPCSKLLLFLIDFIIVAVANSNKRALYAPSDSLFLMYVLTHV